MSAPNEEQGAAHAAAGEQSVLAKLPRTRPQRSSARRAAARELRARPSSKRAPSGSDRAGATGESEGTDGTRAGAESKRRSANGNRASAGAKRASGASSGSAQKRAQARARSTDAARRPPARSGASATRSRPRTQAVPRQGFESEGGGLHGSVEPPGGTELLTSAVEIVGELAKSGLSTGERLLRDVLSRFSR
jgi:hypothetical protein